MLAVVFDYFGTLTPGVDPKKRNEWFRTVGTALGCDPGVFAGWMDRQSPNRDVGATGDLTETLRAGSRAAGHDPTPDQLAAGVRERLATQRVLAEPRTEAAGVLRALKDRGPRVGVLSDCSIDLPHHWPDLPVAPYVDAPVFSVEVGRRKPDPVMYQTVCERLGAEPADCLYVGDGGSDELAGADRAGLRAVLLAGPDWDNSLRYGPSVPWAGPVIETLTAVPALLDDIDQVVER